jgi:hypothetical protein
MVWVDIDTITTTTTLIYNLAQRLCSTHANDFASLEDFVEYSH